jgi:hypothetical protein
MEAIQVAKEIEGKINELELLKKELPAAIYHQGKTAADYDKQLALTIVRLRNGTEMQFEGYTVKDPPVSIMERIAKGICWQEALTMDTAEGKLKAIDSAIKTTMAQLNGFQSINRYLAEV